jgi:hypothetical protein
VVTERIDWRDAEPTILQRERAAMSDRAPDMDWTDEMAGGWQGLAPGWPRGLSPPRNLDRLLHGRRLRLAVRYTQGFPMAPPRVDPLDPLPPPERRADHRWHLNGDGSLCLLFSAADWPEHATAVDLVEKACGWFVEYLALEAELIDEMSEVGPLSGNAALEAALATL